MILMIFVLQFASNQTIAAGFALSDAVLEKYEAKLISAEDGEEITEAVEGLKRDVASVLKCETNEVKAERGEESEYIVEAPAKHVIACGKLLGISEEENKAIFKRIIKAGK